MSNQQCCETLDSSTLVLDKLLRLQIESAAERLCVPARHFGRIRDEGVFTSNSSTTKWSSPMTKVCNREDR
ncbi:hypothetical protein [Nostoc sp. FACHB-888]|uniref:hypothetical protein n=1 Tax=Nostoc sp. FACHB-888 TaxID=2692842 RepID=UPI0019C3D60E|nr:hypothetical protein [Nostoc sp. FACHB-888]MBD2248281.1 hypothetical protein [Nostoc sp. FACHB-888]